MNLSYVKNYFSSYTKKCENHDIVVKQEPVEGIRYIVENIRVDDFNTLYEKFKSFEDEKIFITFNNCYFKQFGFNTTSYQKYLKNKLDFVNCNFKEFNINNFNTDKCKLEWNNLFSVSNKIESLWITASSISEEILLDSTFFNYSLIINKLTIQENSSLINLKILNQDNIDVIIKDSNIQILNLNNSPVNKSQFENFQFKGITSFTNSDFKEISIFRNVDFKEFVNFSNTIFQSGLDLDDTNIEKDISLKKIKILDIKNTSQETFRILKHSSGKIGNMIEYNKYHSLELNKNHQNIWKQNNTVVELLLKYIVSLVHKYSSNFSSNWFLPLFWIVIVSLITNYNIGNDISFECLFKYMSILSNVDDFKSYGIMAFNKVSLGYLYYQFITATRRDTK